MEIVDFCERRRAKAGKDATLQIRLHDVLAAHELLSEAINQMQESLDDQQVVGLLRHAIAVLEE